MSVPKQQKTLFIQEAKGEWKVRAHNIPEPAAGQVLVRVEATGLNPADWKIHDFDVMIKSYPGIIGFDGAGVIVKVGEGVDNVVVGDKV